MNSARLTLTLLLLAAILAGVVPTIRRAVVQIVPSATSRQYLTVDQAIEVATGHRDNAELWLAAAEFARSRLGQSEGVRQYASPEAFAQQERLWGPAPSVRDVDDAYQEAIRRVPEAPAPRMRYALFLADRVGDVSLGEEEAEQELAPDQQQLLDAMREQAEQVRSLDPGNAAADYLLAWAALAQGSSDAALAEVAAALGKSGLSTYQSEAARALVELVEQGSIPAPTRGSAAIAMGAGSALSLGAPTRDLARRLVALGDEFRHVGNHRQAILCYEAIIHAGRLMRAGAYTMMDGMMGGAVVMIAASSPDWTPGAEGCAATREENERRRRLRTEGLCGYLSEHGREELAAVYREEVAATERWREDTREVSQEMVANIMRQFWASAAPLGLMAWLMLAAMINVGVLIGLASLLSRWWREPPRGPEWTYGRWFALLMAIVLPAAVAGVTPYLTLLGSETADAGPNAWIAPAVALVLGFAVWAVAVWIAALRRRARLPEEQRLGRARSWLRGMRALIAPTLAALAVLAVLGIHPIQRNLEESDRQTKQMLIEGEVAYYGIGE